VLEHWLVSFTKFDEKKKQRKILFSGIFASLLGSLLPLPRVLYAIAADGLIFRFISWIHPRLQTPIVATILGGIASGRKDIRQRTVKYSFFVSSTDGINVWYKEISWNDVNWNITCIFISFDFSFISTVENKSTNGNSLISIFSYQPIDDPLLRSNTPDNPSFFRELFRPTYSHPTVYSAKITKYLIGLLSIK